MAQTDTGFDFEFAQLLELSGSVEALAFSVATATSTGQVSFVYKFNVKP